MSKNVYIHKFEKNKKTETNNEKLQFGQIKNQGNNHKEKALPCTHFLNFFFLILYATKNLAKL